MKVKQYVNSSREKESIMKKGLLLLFLVLSGLCAGLTTTDTQAYRRRGYYYKGRYYPRGYYYRYPYRYDDYYYRRPGGSVGLYFGGGPGYYGGWRRRGWRRRRGPIGGVGFSVGF